MPEIPESTLDAKAALAVVLPLLAQSRGDWSTFVTGKVPPGWPTSLEPPPNVAVLGGLTFEDARTAVFEYPRTSVRAKFEYRDHIERNGWHRRPEFPDGGFDAGMFTGYLLGSESAIVASRAGTPFEQTVVVTVRPATDSPNPEDRVAALKETLRFPRLIPPPGIRADGAGSCGGGDHTTHNLRLKTDRAPGELMTFFSAQLADRSWRLGNATVTDTNATQWVEADYHGAVWRGVLGVYANGSARDIFIHITKTTA